MNPPPVTHSENSSKIVNLSEFKKNLRDPDGAIPKGSGESFWTLFFIVLHLAIFATGFLALQQDMAGVVQKKERENSLVLSLAQAGIRDRTRDFFHLGLTLARSRDFQNMDCPGMESILFQLMARHPEISGAWIVNSLGQRSVELVKPGQERLGAQLFVPALGSTSALYRVAGVLFNEANYTNHLAVEIPIKDSLYIPVGRLYLTLQLGFLENIAESILKHQAGVLTIVDSTGVVLYSPNPKLVFAQANIAKTNPFLALLFGKEVSFAPASRGGEEDPPDIDSEPGMELTLHHSLKFGSTHFQENGQDLFLSYKCLKDHLEEPLPGWYLLLIQPTPTTANESLYLYFFDIAIALLALFFSFTLYRMVL